MQRTQLPCRSQIDLSSRGSRNRRARSLCCAWVLFGGWRQPALGRIVDARRATVRIADLEPEAGAGADVLAGRLRSPRLFDGLRNQAAGGLFLGSGQLVVGEVLAITELRSARKRRARAVVPNALQVRIAPRCPPLALRLWDVFYRLPQRPQSRGRQRLEGGLALTRLLLRGDQRDEPHTDQADGQRSLDHGCSFY